VAITSSVVGMGFNPSCPCTVILADPTNDMAVPMIVADTIATSSKFERFFNAYNIIYEINVHTLIVFSSTKRVTAIVL
jgi:hypothetical protein